MRSRGYFRPQYFGSHFKKAARLNAIKENFGINKRLLILSQKISGAKIGFGICLLILGSGLSSCTHQSQRTDPYCIITDRPVLDGIYDPNLNNTVDYFCRCEPERDPELAKKLCEEK